MFTKSSSGYPKIIHTKITNKQTNKQKTHIFRSTISQPNQVRSLWNFQEILLWVSQDDSNKKLKNSLWIDNISAKLSQIFMKLSVKLPMLKLLGLLKATSQGAWRATLGGWRPLARGSKGPPSRQKATIQGARKSPQVARKAPQVAEGHQPGADK